MEQNENDFKDPEDGFCDKTNSEGVISNGEVHFFFFFIYKTVVFPTQAEYSYFSADFRLKIFLYYS